jgi:hypothetical protein
VTGTDPGPDGVRGTGDDAGSRVFYEPGGGQAHPVAQLHHHATGFSKEYRGVELTMNRRFVGRWQAVGAVTVGVQRERLGDARERCICWPRDVWLISRQDIRHTGDWQVPLAGAAWVTVRFPCDASDNSDVFTDGVTLSARKGESSGVSRATGRIFEIG